MRSRERRKSRLGLVAVLVVMGLSLVLAATAGAEVRSGSVTDPVDGGLPAGLDLVSVDVGYDPTAGTITAQMTTRGAPELGLPAGLAIGLGALQNGECAGPYALILGIDSSPPEAAWQFGVSEGSAAMSVNGTTTSLSATGPALAGQAFNCAEGLSFVREGGSTVFKDDTAPIQLAGPPPAPPAAPSNPTPAPTPASPPTPTPKPNLVVPSKTVTLQRNAWKKVAVKITNTGDAAAVKVAVKVGKARGVAIRPKSGKLNLKSIAPGKSKVVAFKAMLTRKAKRSSMLTLAIIGGKGLRATGSVTLETWTKPPPKKKGKKEKAPPPAATSPLAERIFYAYRSEANESAKLIGYAFIDGEWAYHGIPAEGLPTCTSTTGDGTKEGAEGCVKYTFDPATGTVTIGSATGKLNPGGDLEVDGETYSATSIPPAGTQLALEQEYIGYQGICGLITGCSTW